MIDTFRGEYAFLSNFYNARIKYNGRTFMSSEAAFQSEKTLNEAEKDWFVGIGPVKAKALGRKVHLRPDWDDVKVKIMLDIVRAKFKQNAWLAKKTTGNRKRETRRRQQPWRRFLGRSLRQNWRKPSRPYIDAGTHRTPHQKFILNNR